VKHGRLYAATDVARFAAVDLKTIHAWVARGSLVGGRSAGGQLRFRRTDVVEFLRERGFPLPKSLLDEKPRVLLVGQVAEALEHALARAEVVREGSPVAALLGLREILPDALVLGPTLGFSRTSIVRELAEIEPRLLVAVVAASPADALSLRDAGARVAGTLDDLAIWVGALFEALGHDERSSRSARDASASRK
jgi:hypothetical protein